jgi:transposase
MATRKFSEQFKESVVREVVEHSRAIADVAKENNVSSQSVSRWVAAHRVENPVEEEISESEAEELKRLRRRVKSLEEEVDILGKATAFFAKKSRP